MGGDGLCVFGGAAVLERTFQREPSLECRAEGKLLKLPACSTMTDEVRRPTERTRTMQLIGSRSGIQSASAENRFAGHGCS
jgi:hypothetical protein